MPETDKQKTTLRSTTAHTFALDGKYCSQNFETFPNGLLLLVLLQGGLRGGADDSSSSVDSADGAFCV